MTDLRTDNPVIIAKKVLEAAQSIDELDTGHGDFELFETLIAETERYMAEGVAPTEWKFTYLELAEALNKPGTKDSKSKEIRRLLKNLKDKINEFSPAIENHLHKADIRQIIELREEQEGRRKYISLASVPMQAKPASTIDDSTPVLIQYEPVTIKSIYGLESIELNRSNALWLYFIAVVPTCIPLFTISFLWSFDKLGLSWLILATVAVLWGYLVYRPFSELLTNGLTKAPSLIRPTLTNIALLTLYPVNERFHIRLRTYKAKCPICGSTMDIVRGKRHLKGRFVSKCKATNEHTYTFDHVKERGVPAHTPMYVPTNPDNQ